MHKLTLLVALLLTGLPTLSAADTFRGQVISENGEPLASARVRVNGVAALVDDAGRFSFELDNDAIARIDVAANDYYRFVHTVSAADLSIGGELFAPIELVAKQPERRLLLFTGDAMLTRRFMQPRDSEPVLVTDATVADDARRLLDPIRPYIGLADFASVNLETTLASEPPGQSLSKSVNFYSPPELATALEEAGFDYVALGNNHTYDYSDGGVTSTLDELAKTGLAWSGLGLDEGSARKPWQGDIFGQPYAFLSYVGWMGTFTPGQAAEGDKGGAALGNGQVFREDLAGVSPTETSVVQFHSGLEYSEDPAMSVVTAMREAIDAGADVAIGHHPHVLQGLEIYRDKLVAYSMGNFLFDQFYTTTRLGMLLYVWMDGSQLHRVEVVPMHVNGYVPTPATGQVRYNVLHRLSKLSARLGTCFRATGAHAVIGGNCVPQALRLPAGTGEITSLRSLGASSLRPALAPQVTGRYRLGTDILQFGDFESTGLFGTDERAWAGGRSVTVDRSLRLRILPGETSARTGMKVFLRDYTPSGTATVTGRLRTEGDVRVTFSLQRRTTSAGFEEGLREGPLMQIGELTTSGNGWQTFSFDYRQPRVGTRAVRLLIDVEDLSDAQTGARLEMDDLAWIEWSTHWLQRDDEPRNLPFGTHIQVR